MVFVSDTMPKKRKREESIVPADITSNKLDIVVSIEACKS